MLVFSIADRFDRLKFYLVCVVLGLLGKLFWYGYVMLMVPGNRPSVTEILLIGEVVNILGGLAGITSYPLVYEFIPLNKLSTASAGLWLFRSFLSMILEPVTGFWLLGYSNIVMPGAGSHAVVVLKEPPTAAEMKVLAETLEAETGKRVWTESVAPPGTRSETYRQWALRMSNEDAEHISREIERTESRLRDHQRETAGRTDPAAIATHGQLSSQLGGERAALDAQTAGSREFLEQRIGDRLASVEEGLVGIAVDGESISVALRSVFPIGVDEVEAFAEEIRLKLGVNADALVLLVDPDDRTRFQVVASATAAPSTNSESDPGFAAPARNLAPATSDPETTQLRVM